MTMGRPSLYTPELVETICDRLGKGEPMAVICRDEGFPAYRTVKSWMDEDSELGRSINAAIARAREEGFDSLAAECLEIAEDGSRDYVETDNGPVLDREHVQRSKLRIETRLKLLAKWDPKRYGDKLELAGNADSPLTVVVRKLTDA